jgi:hypothetical protein
MAYADSSSRGEGGRFTAKSPGLTIGAREPISKPCDPRCAPASATEIRPSSRGCSEEIWSRLVFSPVAIENEAARASQGHLVYLGESWSLSYMFCYREPWPTSRSVPEVFHRHAPLHLPLPRLSADHNKKDSFRSLPASSRRDIFALPPHQVQADLLDAYFTFAYLAHPIVSPSRVRSTFADGSISIILLYALLYTGTTHADDAVIYRAGFASRVSAQRSFYNSAKALYHSDAEHDKVVLIQSTFLLHIWWEDPDATMDPWYWLGVTVRAAQSLGMHRSTRESALSKEDQSLWKRIWWSIYVRAPDISGPCRRR